LIGGIKFDALERKHYVGVLDRKVDAGLLSRAAQVLKILRR
jgi:hypothetical protein